MNAEQFWYEATRDIADETANVIVSDRSEMIDFEVRSVATAMYHLFGNLFERAVIFKKKRRGKYMPSGTGAYVAATRVLTATMNRSFTQDDRECLIIIRKGSGDTADNYQSFIEDVISATVVKLKAGELPTTDQTISSIDMLPTAGTLDAINLSRIDMMRLGAQFQFKLESSITDFIDWLSHDEIIRWNTADRKNQGRIAAYLSGPLVLLKKSDNLSGYGTLVGRYPGYPRRVVDRTDDIDLPEGSPTNIAILRLQRTLRRIYTQNPMQAAVFNSDLKNLVEMAHTAYGFSAQSQEVKKTVEALN